MSSSLVALCAPPPILVYAIHLGCLGSCYRNLPVYAYSIAIIIGYMCCLSLLYELLGPTSRTNTAFAIPSLLPAIDDLLLLLLYMFFPSYCSSGWKYIFSSLFCSILCPAHMSMSISICPCQHVHVNMSMSTCLCPCRENMNTHRWAVN
jgi:hypothetical protein